jgi:hypothetical protein
MTLRTWNREVGMGPIGKESSFSTVTLSLHVVSANALRNISSGLKSPCTVSPDRRYNVTVEKLLSFPIGPIPASLFHVDSTMRKCVKADLTHELEREVCPSFTLPSFDKTLTVLICLFLDTEQIYTVCNLITCYFFHDLWIPESPC